MPDHQCDVAIIGAGTAGLSAERSARLQGAKTLLIDDKFAGTVYASVGCMPSKLLIAAAGAAHACHRASIFGVNAGGIYVDGRAVLQRLWAERAKFSQRTLQGISDLTDGICVKSKVRFSGPTQLDLANGARVQARAIIIATGAYPLVPEPIDGLHCATKPDGRQIGAELFCPGADLMAHLLAWAIERGGTAASRLDTPFFHPTLEEGLKPALRAICKASANALSLDLDVGDPSGA